MLSITNKGVGLLSTLVGTNLFDYWPKNCAETYSISDLRFGLRD